MRRFILRIMRIELRQIGTKNREKPSKDFFFFYCRDIYCTKRKRKRYLFTVCSDAGTPCSTSFALISSGPIVP